MSNQDKYEIVVGLEVHAQLLTKSKLFCGDSTAFDAEPNTNVSPITLGHPGTLPKMNRKAIEFAIKMGLVCHCDIERYNYFARKNYFYPDLPKGYQVSQHTTPICKGGYITIKTNEGDRNIRLNRIHLEEDAGKSLHDADIDYTCIDYNRAGTPLIEIVSEPDIRSGEEAYAYVSIIRKFVRYLDICDGNMEEGSMRCDANISVRLKGETKLGTKVEVKNLNSIRNVKRAIEFEAKRLIGILEEGGVIIQQTRSFDPAGGGTTFAIRDKEDADDYRYFAEPDLTPFHLKEEFIENIRASVPVMPDDRIKKYTSSLQLSEYDASVLAEEKTFADYFERIIASFETEVTARPKAAANWMLGPVKSWMNENNKEMHEFPVPPSGIAALINMVEEEKLSFSVAVTKVFPELVKQPGADPVKIATANDLLMELDSSSVNLMIEEVLLKFVDKVTEYKKGKKGLLALFVGEVIKKSKGKADPRLVNELIIQKLKS